MPEDLRTVSIITVTYNSEKTIVATMESVLAQTYLALTQESKGSPTPLIEYLVVDGASKDRTVEIAESFRVRMEEAGIRLRIQSEPDQGIYDAMNKGIRMATGDIIGIINSDDWYEPEAVETAVETFAAAGCDAMFANIRLHRADGSSFVKKARQRRFQTSRDWNHPTMFVKAEVYKSHQFRQKGIHDDYGCYLQLCREGYKIVTVDRVLADFRMGGASNCKNLKECIHRIGDRYRWCYRINGYSRWYLAECIFIEAVKFILG